MRFFLMWNRAKIRIHSVNALSSWAFLCQTRLKCKSSARVKIVLKKDWIVKKCWKKCKKKLKCLKKFFEKIGKNQKKSEKIEKKNNQK